MPRPRWDGAPATRSMPCARRRSCGGWLRGLGYSLLLAGLEPLQEQEVRLVVGGASLELGLPGKPPRPVLVQFETDFHADQCVATRPAPRPLFIAIYSGAFLRRRAASHSRRAKTIRLLRERPSA